MDVDQLETFLTVLTYGGFHRAAEALHVSQPAVTGRIGALEDSLGVTLFTRSGGKCSISAAGKALRPHAEQILRTVALARKAVHELQPSAVDALRIAASLSLCTYFLPDVIRDYKAAHPRVMVNLRSGESADVLKMVVNGEAEIGVARSLNHPDVETTTLRDDPLILVGHSDHPLAKKHRVEIREVGSWPLIFYDRGGSDWTLSQSIFCRAGFLPNTVLEVETIEAAKRMVERKLGFCFLPQISLVEEIRLRKLVVIKIINVEPLHRTLDVIRPRHRALSVAAQALLQILRVAAGKPASLNRPNRPQLKRPRSAKG